MSRLSRFVGKTRQGQPQPAWRMPSIAIAVGIAAVAGFAGLAAQSKAKVKALPVPDSSNYSLSTQITKANVGQLEMAWFYPYGAPTFSPVFANDVLFGHGRNEPPRIPVVTQRLLVKPMPSGLPASTIPTPQ